MSRRFHMRECLIGYAPYVGFRRSPREVKMPTTPKAPASTSAIDRLALQATSVRGAHPSSYDGAPICFEAETASYASLEFSCFQAEAASIPTCAYYCFCADGAGPQSF